MSQLSHLKEYQQTQKKLNCFGKASLRKLTHVSFNLMLSPLSDLRLNEIHSRELGGRHWSEVAVG